MSLDEGYPGIPCTILVLFCISDTVRKKKIQEPMQFMLLGIKFTEAIMISHIPLNFRIYPPFPYCHIIPCPEHAFKKLVLNKKFIRRYWPKMTS